MFLGWFRSCDLGYYDDDGEIYIVDRISDFISFRGIKISPAEVETVLATHPAVLQAALIGIPHEADEQHPMALVLRVPGKSVSVLPISISIRRRQGENTDTEASIAII